MASIASLLASALFAALLPPERDTALPRPTGAPTILLPVFTRCMGTCPMTAGYLKAALEKSRTPFSVIVLSFDPEDTAADLRDFRERFALPASWAIVHWDDARQLLDSLDFHFMKVEGGFDHPNLSFVFSPAGKWAATLSGAQFEPAELVAARERALAADDPSALRRVRAWLVRPEAWIVLACAGMLLALIAIVVAPRMRASHR